MTTFTLTLDLSSIYVTDAPIFEILVDGVVVTSFPVTGSYTMTDYTFSSEHSVPNVSFRFNDTSTETGRSIAINDVEINGVAVASSSLSDDNLSQGETSIVDTASESSSFNADPSENDFGSPTHTGTVNNDTIFQNGNSDDIMHGGDGNDKLISTLGDDVLFGQNGNDDLNSGDGNDILVGGAGDDTLDGGDGNDHLYGGAGDDVLQSGDGNDSLYGGDGNDVIHAQGGDNLINGGNGNDTITGFHGEDIIYGDAGDDEISGSRGNDVLYGGEGNDDLYGNLGNDTLNGGAGDDRLYGNFGANVLDGGEGNDIVDGGSDNDTLYGGDGDDTVSGRAGNDVFYDERGNDHYSGGGGTDDIYFDKDWHEYAITLAYLGAATGFSVVDIDTGETDTVFGFENFHFKDVSKTPVTIINDKPEITSNGGGNSAVIDINENTTTVTTVTATDMESTTAELSYAISGGLDASLFSIDAATGDLSFTTAPDYERPDDYNSDNIYDVEVQVTDHGGQVDTQSLSVSVDDVTEPDIGNTIATSAAIALGETVFYNTDSSGDHDWFSIDLTANVEYVIETHGTASGKGTSDDPHIYNIYDSLVALLGGTGEGNIDNDAGIGTDSFVTYTPIVSGTYYIDAGSLGTETGVATLRISETDDVDYIEGTSGNDTLNGSADDDTLDGLGGDDTLDGGDGVNVLYGDDGADTFMLSATNAHNSIADFDEAEGDVLDISNIVTGFDAVNDDIDDFLQFLTVGDDTVVKVDANGTLGGANFTEVAVLESNVGEIVQNLYDNGNIVI